MDVFIGNLVLMLLWAEAALQSFSQNLKENTHVEVWFQ